MMRGNTKVNDRDEFDYIDYHDREAKLNNFDAALDKFLAQYDSEHGLKSDIVYETLLNLCITWRTMAENKCGTVVVRKIDEKQDRLTKHIHSIIQQPLSEVMSDKYDRFTVPQNKEKE